MRRETTFVIALIAAIILFSADPLQSQEGFGAGAGGAQAQAKKFIASPTQVVAIRAGRLFDPKSGTILTNQVVLIKGDRITDVGPTVQIPREARVFDLIRPRCFRA